MAIIAGRENRLSRHRPGDRLAADAPFGDGGVVWLVRLIIPAAGAHPDGPPVGTAKAPSISLVNRIILGRP
jgi:hypothetical protein